MGDDGFEPPKSNDNRFTVCSIWPLWKSPIRWWMLTGSNRWPFARQANALPAELNIQQQNIWYNKLFFLSISEKHIFLLYGIQILLSTKNWVSLKWLITPFYDFSLQLHCTISSFVHNYQIRRNLHQNLIVLAP